MKRIIVIFIIVMISGSNIFGQSRFNSCLVNFEDDPCWAGVFSIINDSAAGNIWQVCSPNKPVFSSAHSAPHAILTDSSGTYPVNDSSSFIIKALTYSSGGDIPVIGGWYKFDSDSLRDFGRIDISYDHGVTWQDVLTGSSIFWFTPRPVFTGRVYQWREFFGWLQPITMYDTIYYRYTFISDNIQTNQQGWMLDDIFLIDHIEGIHEQIPSGDILLFPNPAKDKIFIVSKRFNVSMDVLVMNILGQFQFDQSINSGDATIDISSLKQGLYFIRINSGGRQSFARILKQ